MGAVNPSRCNFWIFRNLARSTADPSDGPLGCRTRVVQRRGIWVMLQPCQYFNHRCDCISCKSHLPSNAYPRYNRHCALLQKAFVGQLFTLHRAICTCNYCIQTQQQKWKHRPKSVRFRTLRPLRRLLLWKRQKRHMCSNLPDSVD